MDFNEGRNHLIQSIWSLAEIPIELIDDLLSICRLGHYPKGTVFLNAGERPETMGFNINGLFRLFYVDNKGNDLTKGFCTPGKFIVSYSAMSQKRESFFSIEALEDSDILEFSYSRWQELIDADIRWYPFCFKLVESVYIMKEMREKAFLLDDAQTRYLNFMEQIGDLEDRIKLYHIASYLGITPEALSRIRKRVKESRHV